MERVQQVTFLISAARRDGVRPNIHRLGTTKVFRRVGIVGVQLQCLGKLQESLGNKTLPNENHSELVVDVGPFQAFCNAAR